MRNPGAGEELRFLETANATGGSLLVAELTMIPGAKGPVPHVHSNQEERFEILEGRARFKVGRERFDRGSGDTVVAPPGVGHGFRNPFDEQLQVRITWTPAADLEHFFENLFGLAADGKVNARGAPSLQQIALIIEAHPESPGHLVGIPLFIQRPLLKTMAALGRRAGLKGSYPEYCSHLPR
ncbi:MAG: cupin domain-containing protein [Acidimicrobiia bacterium]